MHVPAPVIIDGYVGDYAKLDYERILTILDCVASFYLDSEGVVMAAAYYLATRCPDLEADVEAALRTFLVRAEAVGMSGPAAEVRPIVDGRETTREAIAAYVAAHRDEAQARADEAAAAAREARRRARAAPPDGVLILFDLFGEHLGVSHALAFFSRRGLETVLSLVDEADAIARRTPGFRAIELTDGAYWLTRRPAGLELVNVPYDTRWALVEEAYWPADFRGEAWDYDVVGDFDLALGPPGRGRFYVLRDGLEFGFQDAAGREVRTRFLPAGPLRAWLARRS